jgi:NADH dehydrogenase
MILVAGATGVLGSEIVRNLLARGEKVRAMTRKTSKPEAVDRLRKAGAETVVADFKDPPSLAAACKGVDGVISTVTSVTTAQAGDSIAATDGQGTINLIDAARKAGVKKFVFVSFDAESFPDAPLPRAKRDVEKHLEKSGLDYTILHPSLFFESWLGPMLFADPAAGTARVYGVGTQRIAYIAVKDVAELAVQSLSRPFASKAIIPFGGPEPISQREAVKLFEEAFGKEFAVTEVPEEALEGQWKAAQDQLEKSFAALMLGIARGFDSGVEPPFKEFPMRMTSPREYVKRLAKSGGK